MKLLALAAAVGATVFAATLAALGMAAVVAVHGLGLGDSRLSKGGDGEDGGKRKNCDSPFHNILLNVSG